MASQTIPQSQRNARPWWIAPALLVVVAVIGLLGYGMVAKDRGQLVDGPLPDLTLTTFDGESVALSSFQGKPMIINFWASWCRECDKEMAMLQEAHERYGEEIVILGLAYTDDRDKSLAYLDQYGITYMNGPDLGARFSDTFRIRGVPESFFVDRDGILRGMQLGVLDGPTLDGWIARLTE